MNTKIRKLSTLAALVVVGSIVAQANAATVTNGKSASADVVIVESTITSHTLTAAQASIAAGQQAAPIAAANGEVKAGATDKLAIKWDEAGCAVDTGNALICSVSGKTAPTVNQAKFTLSAAHGTAALASVSGATNWFSNESAADFKYVVILDDNQSVNPDTYTLLVDAGVVTN